MRLRRLGVAAPAGLLAGVLAGLVMAATFGVGPAYAAAARWGLHDFNAAGGVEHSFSWGDLPASCIPLTGDWDGNGSDTVGAVCPVASNGLEWSWFLQNQHDGGPTDHWFNWGSTGCLPFVGDWDGNGTDTPGTVCGGSNGEWLWRLRTANAGGGVDISFGWGGTGGCWPITGDWNGDRVDTPGLICPANGVWNWRLHNFNAPGVVEYAFAWGGTANCSPVWGDWDGNRTETPGNACRLSNSEWEWAQSDVNAANGVNRLFRWGSTTQRPLVGDWNADGRATVGTTTLAAGAPAPPGGYSLPLPRGAAPRSEYAGPHHDYPAVDIAVVTGTPSYAVVSGTVRLVDDSSCGLGVVLSSAALGADFTYCHFSRHAIGNGASVAPGQLIGYTGNTGNSTGPHLHFGIRAGGVRRCPQSWLLAIYDGRVPPAPSSLPTTGCFF